MWLPWAFPQPEHLSENATTHQQPMNATTSTEVPPPALLSVAALKQERLRGVFLLPPRVGVQVFERLWTFATLAWWLPQQAQ
jgi:hypothetical protein